MKNGWPHEFMIVMASYKNECKLQGARITYLFLFDTCLRAYCCAMLHIYTCAKSICHCTIGPQRWMSTYSWSLQYVVVQSWGGDWTHLISIQPLAWGCRTSKLRHSRTGVPKSCISAFLQRRLHFRSCSMTWISKSITGLGLLFLAHA